MRNKRKSKKGFTLMELSIVIALVAIVSVAAVGVCTLVSNITHDNTVKNEIIQETTLLKTQVQSNIDTILGWSAEEFNQVKEIEDLNLGEYDRIDKITFKKIDNGNKSIIQCTVTLNEDYPFSEDNKFIFTVTKESNNA